MVTSASATSRSPSRSSRNAKLARLGLASLLGLFGCGDDDRAERDVVARIAAPTGDLELDRRVVAELAARDGISDDEARERGLDRLRLVAARREELAALETPPTHPDDLDPDRREHLEHGAMVRLWLREVFEPATTGAKIPDPVLSQNLADPSVSRRLFHPEVWLVCQVLIAPKPVDGAAVLSSLDGEAAAQWQADLERAFTPVVERVLAVADDLLSPRGCDTLAGLVGASEHDVTGESGELELRYERFAFAPSDADNFDATWVDAVTARAEPHLVMPFATQFGRHLVLVTEIRPTSLPDGSLPPDQLEAARKAELREVLEQAWRTDQLQRTLADARDRRVVRLAAEID
jgi:hypothetical protein